MPPHPPSVAGGGLGKRLPTLPADLRDNHYHGIHLLDRQQGTERTVMSGLTTAFPSGGRRFRARLGLGWIGRRRTGGIGGVLAQSGFQVADARLQSSILRAQRGVLQPERRQLLQEWRWLRSRKGRPWLGRQWGASS